MLLQILSFSVILFPDHAFSAVQLSCPDTQKIEEEAEVCEDNGKFGEAGIECLSSLEKAIREQSALAKKSMMNSNAALIDKAGNAQTSNFAGSGADYRIAQKTLEELIDQAKNARAKVESYHLNIFYPEDFDAPEEVIGDVEEFLEESECFSENKNGLMKIVDKIDKHIADLEKTRIASSQKGVTSGNREEGMQNSLVNGVSNTKGQGAAVPVPAGKSQNGTSDITGVQEDKNKQKAK